MNAPIVLRNLVCAALLAAAGCGDTKTAPSEALTRSTYASGEYLSDNRSRSRLTQDWSFHLGDVEGAQTPDFSDIDWRKLDLPHDWSIEGEYREANPAGRAGAFLPGGIGWYRKSLNWNPAWEGKRVNLTFDGIYMNGSIYVNGEKLAHQPYGYIGVNIDVTDFLKPGVNAVAVRVDHSKMPSGRWYTGSGIYRDVWLEVTETVHVIHNGSYVRAAEVTAQSATLLATHEIKNETGKTLTGKGKLSLLDAKGDMVADTIGDVTLKPGEVFALDQSIVIKSPKLWSPETPELYTVVFELSKGDKVLDRYETRTAFRSIEFTVDRGFILNGVTTLIHGMCMHHDGGPVGSAVPIDVWRRRFELLKEAGVNAVRTAHNPFAPEFYDLADEMGFLVMNEAFDGWETEKSVFDYGLYFDDWWEEDLMALIRRDRNHPSIIMWSIGNEVRDPTAETQKKLVDTVKALDSTRPTVQARGYYLPHADIAGFNGHGEYMKALEKHHTEHPDQIMVGTEMTHTLHTRDVYKSKTEYRTRDNPAPWEMRNPKRSPIMKWRAHVKKGVHDVPDFTEEEVWPNVTKSYASSFDNNLVRMPIREEIKAVRDLPYMIGSFRWTAFDYMGEAKYWPERTMNFGVIDLAGLRKGAYHLYKSQWAKDPMVWVDPHWTHPDKEGVTMPVVSYTNLDAAELFVNGKSAGKQEMTDDMQIVWHVPYQPGQIKVIATGDNGEREEIIRNTAGEVSRVALLPDRTMLPADGRSLVHLEINLVDKDGTYNPHADNRVFVYVSGGGRLIGIENGDVLELQSTKDDNRKAFHGKLMALVQSNGDNRSIEVEIASLGLKTKVLVVDVITVD
ncbi:glycoside hydrolase family 2 TIM barrel-domain containing protein [Robiginitomaculum antarcticum]|uniref:glycoside hydrolase family 2 TIM barrel-domain containing protein n=1 Tax=Robiginitomaculum antarcticum TaxID=437507 RepID=UPI00035F4BAF|nr:glycoside hydrolase family 2 TIM barrel-domain containing protein [Robiginitomaculum antarcticum]